MSRNELTSSQFLDIHPSWIKAAPNGLLIYKLLEKSNARASILKLINQHVKIENVDISKSKGIIKKLHLASSSEIQDIVLKAGAIQFSHIIRRSISQHDVKIMRSSLGKELYDFALYEVPITFSSIPSNLNLYTSNRNPIVHLIDAGYYSLKVISHKTPNNYCLKLPKGWGMGYYSKRRMINTTISKKDISFHTNLIADLLEMKESQNNY